MLLVVAKGYRADRLTGFFDPSSTDPMGHNQQPIQGKYALGSGGIFGVGLGASREKWGWLPESHERLHLRDHRRGTRPGRHALRDRAVRRRSPTPACAWRGASPDTFSQLLSAAITVWIVVQAVVNIGAVIGVFPITGVPLPLVSQGLSSVLVTMVGLGMLMSFARREPGRARLWPHAAPSRPDAL